jgi:hypothetical protein
MGTNYNPQIVTSGLVFCMDAANSKSYSYAENLISNTNMDLPLYWTKINIGANTSNAAIAPDGSNTALSLIPAAVPSSETEITTGAGSAVANTTYTFSVYAKANGYNYIRLSFGNTAGWGLAFFNLSTGTLGASTSANLIPRIVTSSNGWYRCSITYTAGRSGFINGDLYITNNDNTYGWTPNGTSGVLLWGPQIESRDSMSQYVPTTGSAISKSNKWTDVVSKNVGTLTAGNYNSENSFSFKGNFITPSSVCVIPNNTNLDTQTPTVEVWMKTNALSQNGFWFEKGAVNTQYSLFQEGTNIQWRQYFSNLAGFATLSTSSTTYLNTTQYFQIVGTFTSGDRRLYINGVQVNSDTQAGTIGTNSSGQTIGQYNLGDYTFDGNIAIVKVYNKVLSPLEVQQNFNALRGRFGV